EVILSFGPDGVTGDTDHVAVANAVADAFDLAAEPLSSEDDIEEDQAAWRAAKLYQLVVPPSQLTTLADMTPTGYGSAEGSKQLTLELGGVACVKMVDTRRE